MDPSETRLVGKSNVRVTVAGLGGAPYAKLSGAGAEDQARGTIAAAYKAGVRYFDTAPLYGVGVSEDRLGGALRTLAASDYVISTKVGRYLEKPTDEADRTLVVDYGYDATLRAFEQSLQRLGVDHVDILLIHDLDTFTHGTREAYEQRLREAMRGAYRAISELRAQGVVKAIGIGVNEVEPCLRFGREADFDCLMLAGRYTLLDQTAQDELLPLLQLKGASLLVAGPFNSGILATGPVPEAIYDSRPASLEVRNRVRQLQEVCERHGVSLAACALQFPLAHPAVASVVAGAASDVEVRQNVQAFSTTVPSDLWAELKHLGLLRPDARVPPSEGAAVR